MASRMSDPRTMERLGDIVDRTVKRLPLSRRLEDYAVWTVWDDTVGPAIARNARPEKLRNGTLFVRVRAAAWMQQLHYMKDIMLEKLNRRLGREVITNIFFVVGDVTAEPPRGDPADAAELPAVDTTRLPQQALDGIDDPELRDSLRRLLLNHLRKRG
ncbi:MAG: DUF721 domain-containing protein [Deltaproteobacteria bacterium]|nr:DUF721 domain-containing protein [Deltaproteobacteria bacterium]